MRYRGSGRGVDSVYLVAGDRAACSWMGLVGMVILDCNVMRYGKSP